MSREKYQELTQDELLDKIEELEGKIVDYKKETKTTKSESSKTIENLQARIEELEKSNKKTENDDFLKNKKISEDEKKVYEEKIAKGYDKEDAYLIATKESSKISANQEEIWKNDLPWNDIIIWGKEIRFSDLWKLSQEEYNKVRDDIDAWKIKLVNEK